MEGQSSVLCPPASALIHLHLKVNQNYHGLNYHKGKSGPLAIRKTLRCWTEHVKEMGSRGGERLEHKSHEKQLGELMVFSLEKRRLRGTFYLSTTP